MMWLPINFLKDPFRKACVHSIIELPVGVEGEVYTLMKPSSLVFHRKDLCEVRVKPEMSSYFQMKCTDKMYPPAQNCQ